MTERVLTNVSQACMKACVVLLGDGPTASAALRSLTDACSVVCVLRSITQPADEQLEAAANAHGIPIRPLKDSRELADFVMQLRPDGVVISSFNKILPPDMLALSKFINVHYAPLPRYRGRACVNWAIINGETAAAISIHLLSPGLDEGNILYQERVEITQTDTAQSLYQKLNTIQERELGRTVVHALSGETGAAQNHEDASYGCGRLPEDGEIDWTKSSNEIDRLVRALSPFPSAFTHLGLQRLAIVQAEPMRNPPRYEGRVPGRVVSRSKTEGWVDILTGDGVFRLRALLPPSGVVTPAATLLRSTRTTLGLSRQSLLQYIIKLETRLANLEATLCNPDPAWHEVYPAQFPSLEN